MRVPRPLAVLLYLVPWVLALVFFGQLVVKRYPLGGIFIADAFMTGEDSPWVQRFLPAERATESGPQEDGWSGQRITGDPVYFTARTPGPYDTVDVEIDYRPVAQKLIELGMVRDAEGKNLEMRPLFSSEIVSSPFRRVDSLGVSGYLAPSVPASRLIDPDPRGLAVWNASSSMPLLADPAASSTATPVSLRGSHDFYLVPSGGEIRATFVLQAANRSQGNDVAVFRIFRGEEEVGQETFGLSGSRDTRMGGKIQHEVFVGEAKPGVYRISFLAKDDVFVREIRTTSAHWVVGPRLVFGDVVGYATSTMPGHAWTNSRHLVAETFHNEGLQDVSFGTARMRLAKTHTTYRADREGQIGDVVELLAPRGDIRFVGDAFFALRAGAFFEPKPRRLTEATDFKAEGITAVRTPFELPEELEGGWYRSRVTFALDPSQDRLRFVLSAPGISSRLGSVDVRAVRLTYRRPAVGFDAWWRTLRQELANAWHRL